MSYKGPAVATGKDLSFVIAASGDGSTGAYAGSSNAATALKSVNSTETYMKVTDDGKPDGNYIILPNNCMIIGTKVQIVEEFKAYSTWSGEGSNTGSSLSTLNWDYNFSKGIYVGTTWADASAITSQTASSAGTYLGNMGVLVFGMTQSYGSLKDADPFTTSNWATGTFTNSHRAVITTGGAVSFGVKGGSSGHVGSAANTAQNNFLAQGKAIYTLTYVEL